MHIRLLPALAILSLLALVATACAPQLGAQPSPSLAPELTSVASTAATPEVVSSGTSCAKLACTKTRTEAGTDETVQGAFDEPAAQATIALPQEQRTDSEGAVSVGVTPASTAPGSLIFQVSMNTHSVELNYDMTKIATLRDDQGRTYPVKGWDGGTGGHHRSGVLTFQAMPGEAAKSLELDLAGIDNVPHRLFKWDVQKGGQG